VETGKVGLAFLGDLRVCFCIDLTPSDGQGEGYPGRAVLLVAAAARIVIAKSIDNDVPDRFKLLDNHRLAQWYYKHPKSERLPVPSQNLNADVLMMESPEDWYRCDGPSFCGGRSRNGRGSRGH
jgi:hypothetical protein